MTESTRPRPRMARFGCFELDLDSAELTRRGIPVRLQPQPASVLLLLVRNAGRLVTHETIREHIGWSVAADQTIHTCVSQLRKTLGDPAKSPVFIETIARRGSRFIAPVLGVTTEGVARQKWHLKSGKIKTSLRVAAIGVLAAAGTLLIATLQASRAPDVTQSLAPLRKPPVNRAAWLAYLRGRYLLEEAGPDSLARSLEQFQRAVALDSTFAAAYVGVAEVYSRLPVQDLADKSIRALEAVERALRLDPSLPEGHLLLGKLRATYRRDLTGAEESFARAVVLDPGSARTRNAYATHLTRLGRHAEAIAQLEEAIRIDPVSAGVRGDAGMAYFLAGDFDRAREHCAVGIELEPDNVALHWCLMRSYQRLGRSEDELDVAFALMRIFQLSPEAFESLEQVPVREALDDFWRGQALWFTREIERGSPRQYLLAVTYGTLGEHDLALEWLGRAAAERVPAVMMMNVDPAFEALRSDRRFAELLVEVGLGERSG